MLTFIAPHQPHIDDIKRLIWVVGARFGVLTDYPGMAYKKILEPFKNDECTLFQSNRVNAAHEALLGF